MDQFLKAALLNHAGDILRSVTGLNSELVATSTEIPDKPRERRMDVLFKVTKQDKPRFHLIEVQNELDETMGYRMAEYALRVCGSNNFAPVHGYVLLLAYHENTPEPPYQMNDDGETLLTYKYTNIKVYTFTKADFAGAGPGMLILAPLSQHIPIEEFETYAQALLEQLPDSNERNVFGALFLHFASHRARRYTNRREIEEMVYTMLRKVGFHMGVFDEILTSNTVVESLVESAEKRGIAIGIMEGKAEGKAEAIMTIWTVRFGLPPEKVKIALLAASPDVLETVLAHIATGSQEELHQELGIS